MYRHECERLGMRPVSHMKFRLELIKKLLAVILARGSTVVHGYDSRIACGFMCWCVSVGRIRSCSTEEG